MEKNQNKTYVIIADSQFLVSEGMKNVLDSTDRFEFAGIYVTSFELRQQMISLGEGVVVIDIFSLDIENVWQAVSFFGTLEGFKPLLLVNSISKGDLAILGRAGYRNVLSKNAGREEILLALDLCLKGKKYYSPEILDLLLEGNDDRLLVEESKSLTISELEIVKLIAQGFTTKEIAQRKFVSFHTVNTHRKNIFRKLQVSNVSELVMVAIKSGWIDTIEYYI